MDGLVMLQIFTFSLLSNDTTTASNTTACRAVWCMWIRIHLMVPDTIVFGRCVSRLFLCPREKQGGPIAENMEHKWAEKFQKWISKIKKKNKAEDRSARGTTHMHSILFIFSCEHDRWSHRQIIIARNQNNTPNICVGPHNCSPLVDANTSKLTT